MTSVSEILKEFVKGNNLLPGMTFSTTLLGPVYPEKIDGEWVGHIPKELQRWARDNGYTIEAADYKAGYYILRINEND